MKKKPKRKNREFTFLGKVFLIGSQENPSFAVTIPKSICKAKGLEAGDEIFLSIE